MLRLFRIAVLVLALAPGSLVIAAPREPFPWVDNDGLIDTAEAARDNCLRAQNPAQHDGDADAVGDECDNCAQLPNPDQQNGDGDALGDACESRLGPVVIASSGSPEAGGIAAFLRLSIGQCAAGAAVSSQGAWLFSGFVPAVLKTQERTP